MLSVWVMSVLMDGRIEVCSRNISSLVRLSIREQNANKYIGLLLAMFSPLAFPDGMIVYELTTALPPSSQLSLSPFELYREPLVIIAVADGIELGRGNGPQDTTMNGTASRKDVENKQEEALQNLVRSMEDVRDQFPKALVHQLMVFDYIRQESLGSMPEGAMAIPPQAASKTTTMKTIMCDLTSLLLAEMTTFAKSIQGLPSIESPRNSQSGRIANGYAPWAPEISRRNSQFSASPQRSREGSP